jgi:hypothetical protein
VSIIGIDHHFDLQNHFFRFRCLQVSGTKMMVLGGMVIHIKSGHGIDTYFDIPMPRSMNEWWKKWFYLGNDVAALLPVFTGNHLIPQPNWEYGVVKKDLGKSQPLREVVQQL